MASGKIGQARSSVALRTVFHGAALAWFLRVWLWHLSPQAALLPGAIGFGWFFKYMTFWSFTLQTLTLAACLLDDLLCLRESSSKTSRGSSAFVLAGSSRVGIRSGSSSSGYGAPGADASNTNSSHGGCAHSESRSRVDSASSISGSDASDTDSTEASGNSCSSSNGDGAGGMVARVSDDMACMAFAFAHLVSVMFYALKSATGASGGVVEGAGLLRPQWLCPTVHLLNSIVAWGDLLLSQPRRSFTGRSRTCCCVLATCYMGFILMCREVNGRFPYPFLNKLPYPSGFMVTAVCAVLLFSGFFQMGSFLNSLLASSGSRAQLQITMVHSEGERRMGCEAGGQLSTSSRLQTCSYEGSCQAKGKLRRRSPHSEIPDAIVLIGPKLGSSKF